MEYQHEAYSRFECIVNAICIFVAPLKPNPKQFAHATLDPL